MRKIQKLTKALKKLTNMRSSASAPAKKGTASQPAKKAPAAKKKTQPIAAAKSAAKATGKKAPAAKPAKKVAAKPAPAVKPAKAAASAKPEAKDQKKKAATPAAAAAPAKPEKAAKKAAPAPAAPKKAEPAPEEAPAAKPAKAKKAREEAEPKAEAQAAAPQAAQAPEDDEIILTDAEGRRYCRVKDCDQAATVDSYCRYHYLLFWKNIQNRKKILSEGKLARYVEELTARYPDKFLELLRKDLRSEKDFTAAIQELEIDESGTDAEFEDEAQSYLDEVRGMSSEPTNEREEDF